MASSASGSGWVTLPEDGPLGPLALRYELITPASVPAGNEPVVVVTPGGQADRSGLRWLALWLAKETGRATLIWDRPNCVGESALCFSGSASEAEMHVSVVGPKPPCFLSNSSAPSDLIPPNWQAEALHGLLIALGFSRAVLVGQVGGPPTLRWVAKTQ